MSTLNTTNNKKYTLTGVSEEIELGKDGLKLKNLSNVDFALTDTENELINLQIAEATQDSHAVNKTQLDVVETLIQDHIATPQIDPYASNILNNTINFNNKLSSADDTVQKALDTLDDAAGGTGGTTTLDTINFNNKLSSADDTVQKALDTLDDAAGGTGGTTTLDTSNFNNKLSSADDTVQKALDTLDDYDLLDDTLINDESHWSSEKIQTEINSSTGVDSGVVSYDMINSLKILDNVSYYEIPSTSGHIDFNKQYILVDAYAEDDRTGNPAYPIEGQIDYTNEYLRQCIIKLPDASLVTNKIYTISNRRVLIKEDNSWSILLETFDSQKITGLDDIHESSFKSRVSVGGVGASVQIISDGTNWVLLNKYGGVYFEGGAYETDVCFLGDNAGQNWNRWNINFTLSKVINSRLIRNGTHTESFKTAFTKHISDNFSDFDIASIPNDSIVIVQNSDDLQYYIWVKENSTDPFLIRYSSRSPTTAYGFQGFVKFVDGYPDASLYNNRDYIMYEQITDDLDSWVCLYKEVGDTTWTEMTDTDNHDIEFERCDDLVLIGHSCGVNNMGQSVISIGEDAATNNRADYVMAIGEDTAMYNYCSHSIFIGNFSGFSAGSSYANYNYNLGIGEKSLYSISGSDNIGLGYSSGKNLNNNMYDKCIFIGSFSGNVNSKDYKLQIGNLKSNESSTESLCDENSFITGIMGGDNKYLNLNSRLSCNGQIVSKTLSEQIPNNFSNTSLTSVNMSANATYFIQSSAEYAANKYPIGAIIEIEKGDADSEIVQVYSHKDTSFRTYVKRDIDNKWEGLTIPLHLSGSSLTQVVNFDCNVGNMHKLDLTGLTTSPEITFMNLTPGAIYTLYITQAIGTHVDVTFGNTILWENGSSYVTTKSDVAKDIIQISYDGDTIYGNTKLNFN